MGLVSLKFIVFVFCVILCCYIVSIRLKKYILLCANILFLFSFGGRNAVILIVMTVLSYVSGKVIDRKRERKVLVCAIIVALLPLVLYKYFDFLVFNLNYITGLFSVKIPTIMENVIVPVGISFYTFRIIAYLSDKYTLKNEENVSFVDYFVYISFFPTLLSGPIDRPKNFIEQINEDTQFCAEDFKYGFALILLGYFQKLIVADRLAVIVNNVFGYYNNYSSFQLFVTSIFYSIQIYCDFAGYTNIALGIARMMGYKCIQNFKQPYLAVSIKDFWRRWHISLSSWLRDYVYIPLGGNRKGEVRKSINLMITFLVSGLWHGVGWKFLVWGGLHGVYQLAGDVWLKVRKCRVGKLSSSGEHGWRKAVHIVGTFLLVNFAWVIFWGDSFNVSLHILKNMLNISSVSFAWIQSFGMSNTETIVLTLALLFLISIDWFAEHSVDLIEKVIHLALPIRWLIWYIFIFLIVLFGIYGAGYDSSQFIYFQF